MILVFGETGQVAHELKSFANIVTLNRSQADLSNPIACGDIIIKKNPKAVINAAAYTSVDNAEKEEELATVINGDTPSYMAKVCARMNIPFIHISTDYVFSGKGDEPFVPYSVTSPQSAYGRSKEVGEKGVIESGAIYGIIRTSWVFSSTGKNFVKTMLDLANVRNELSIVSDQIGAPTPARDIASACYQMAINLEANQSKSGIYHFSGTPNVSWHDFAVEIFRQAGRDVNLTPILSADYPTSVTRPLNSRLNCESTLLQFGIQQPDWRMGLSAVLGELMELG